MAPRPNTETISAPRQTVDFIREHLARYAQHLGRSPQLSQFVAEACRKLVNEDLDWLRQNGLLDPPGVNGEEEAASWDSGPPATKSQRTKRS